MKLEQLCHSIWSVFLHKITDLNRFIIPTTKHKNIHDCKLMFKIMSHVHEIRSDSHLTPAVKILKCNYFLECDVILQEVYYGVPHVMVLTKNDMLKKVNFSNLTKIPIIYCQASCIGLLSTGIKNAENRFSVILF